MLLAKEHSSHLVFALQPSTDPANFGTPEGQTLPITFFLKNTLFYF
jgi:hypothetical protein